MLPHDAGRGVLPCAMLLLLPVADAKKSGAGMGGVYWAFIVIGLLVIGIIGFVIFQYWKRQRLLAKAEQDAVIVQKSAVQNYEQSKLDAFHAHFARDLELAAKKRELQVDPETQRAVNFARSAQRKEVFDLIDKGRVDVNSTDSYGRTLLMIGAEIGDSRLCDGLLRRGADINFRNKFNGATVLHFAYQFEHDSLGLSLVARGADDTIRAIDGRTCYQLHEPDYDVEAAQGGAPEQQAPAPRRDMNAPGGGRGGIGKRSRKQSRADGGHNYDKMGDPYGQQQVPGVVQQKYMPEATGSNTIRWGIHDI